MLDLNLCSKCQINPRVKGKARCNDCGYKPAKPRSAELQAQPCSKCGIETRYKNHSWCRQCIKEQGVTNKTFESRKANRDRYHERNKDKPCIQCKVNPRKPWKTKCVDCWELPSEKSREYALRSLENRANDPCSKCGIGKRQYHKTYCVDCETPKEIKDFYKQNSAIKNENVPCSKCGVGERYNGNSWCLDCTYEKNTENRRKPEFKVRDRINSIKSRYGLSIEQYNEILDFQNHSCAICKSTEPGGKGTWAVDHDHITDNVRGILCVNCNTGIGMLKDNKEVVQRAYFYLEKQERKDLYGQKTN